MSTITKSHLSAKELAFFRKLLERAMAKSLSSITGLEDLASCVLEGRGGEDLARVEALESQLFHGQLADRDRQRVGAIAQALARIERGVYGLCTRCEDAIPAARLEIIPETACCVQCS